ncbi:MAG: hypothetical protein K2N72_03275 [Oscillospiraceae bacterium]|nr:hypothetical protein [Oscillospiraceae bacterium]
MEINECLKLLIENKKFILEQIEKAYEIICDNYLSKFILYIDKKGTPYIKDITECNFGYFSNGEYLPVYTASYFENEGDMENTVDIVSDALYPKAQKKFKETCISENAVTPFQQLQILLRDHSDDYESITHAYDSVAQFNRYMENEYLDIYNRIIDNIKSCNSITEYTEKYFPEILSNCDKF